MPGSRLRALAAKSAPHLDKPARFIAALVVGFAGAEFFLWLNLPLPWILGSMTACMAAALLRLPIAGMEQFRPAMMAIIGVLIGSRFHPEVLGHIPGWLPTMLGLVAYALLYSAFQVPFLRYFGGCDLRTAFCAGVPGGLPEMIQLSEENGGDTRMVALIHGARIFLVVLLLPQFINIIAHVDLGSLTRTQLDFTRLPFDSCLWLVGTAFVGFWVGRLLRLPAAPMLGPMLVSAAIHLTEASDFTPPSEIIVVAQLVLGTLVGCRFVGTAPRLLVRTLALTGVSTAILLAFTAVFALVMTRVSDVGLVPIILAYAPGGLTEMSLIALSLQVEVAFVVSHHVVRVLLVILTASAVMRLVIAKR